MVSSALRKQQYATATANGLKSDVTKQSGHGAVDRYGLLILLLE